MTKKTDEELDEFWMIFVNEKQKRLADAPQSIKDIFVNLRNDIYESWKLSILKVQEAERKNQEDGLSKLKNTFLDVCIPINKYTKWGLSEKTAKEIELYFSIRLGAIIDNKSCPLNEAKPEVSE